MLLSVSPSPQIRVLVREAPAVMLDSDSEVLNLGDVVFHLPVSVSTDPGGLILSDACGTGMSFSSPMILPENSEHPWKVEEKSYRGSLTLVARDANILVINTLPFEDYLRGVVPAEMGPEVYPALEALKAQAVAARSYAFVQMSHPLDKEYDICGTPSCQVYKGFEAEHPMSTEAVEETEGLILTYRDVPMATYYTAACGGHTIQGDLIFSSPVASFFTGVPCYPLPSWKVAGQAVSLSPAGAAALLTAEGDPRAALSRLLGRDPGQHCENLSEDPNLVHSGCEEFAASSFFDDLETGGAPHHGAGMVELLGRFMLRSGTLSVGKGIVQRADPEGLLLLGESEPRSWNRPALFIETMDSLQAVDSLNLFPGDRVRLYSENDRLRVLILSRPRDPSSADGRARLSRWSRYRSWSEIAEWTGVEGARELAILSKSQEGRILSLRVNGISNSTILERLQVRFTLKLPETWFSMVPTPEGVFFFGKGWGHGVGMCQEGAFGMAASGKSFEEILDHYYPGFRIAHW